MKRKYISPEDLAEVKKIDLFTYLSNYEPGELVKKSRNDYVTKTHSSLHNQAIPLLALGSDNMLFSYSNHQDIVNLMGN